MRKAFKAIDSENLKYIDEKSLRRFLKKIGNSPQKNELNAIMRRFDLDGDAKISFQEFVEALTPVQVDLIPNPKRHHFRGQLNEDTQLNKDMISILRQDKS